MLKLSEEGRAARPRWYGVTGMYRIKNEASSTFLRRRAARFLCMPHTHLRTIIGVHSNQDASLAHSDSGVRGIHDVVDDAPPEGENKANKATRRRGTFGGRVSKTEAGTVHLKYFIFTLPTSIGRKENDMKYEHMYFSAAKNKLKNFPDGENNTHVSPRPLLRSRYMMTPTHHAPTPPKKT